MELKCWRNYKHKYKRESDFVYDRIHIRNDTDLLSKNFPLVDSLSYIKHGLLTQNLIFLIIIFAVIQVSLCWTIILM